METPGASPGSLGLLGVWPSGVLQRATVLRFLPSMPTLNWDHNLYCLLPATAISRALSPPWPAPNSRSRRLGSYLGCCQLPSVCPSGHSFGLASRSELRSFSKSKVADSAVACHVGLSESLATKVGNSGPPSSTVSCEKLGIAHLQQLAVKASSAGATWRNILLVNGCAAAFSLQFALGLADANASQIQSLAAMWFPWEEPKAQVEPGLGTCATCIGVVDETLGACNVVANCISSFDDRPVFFAAPWEFSGELVSAVRGLEAKLTSFGATIKEEDNRYVHATFTAEDGVIDDVEFLFSDPLSDATVCIRAASRALDYDDYGRNRKRLEQIRLALNWDEVPILRNRLQKLFFIESPWDTFGPEPPPTFNYKDVLDFATQ